MAQKTNDLFIKIQKDRYRLMTIKRYVPFETDAAKKEKYGIYIYLLHLVIARGFTTTSRKKRTGKKF